MVADAATRRFASRSRSGSPGAGGRGVAGRRGVQQPRSRRRRRGPKGPAAVIAERDAPRPTRYEGGCGTERWANWHAVRWWLRRHLGPRWSTGLAPDENSGAAASTPRSGWPGRGADERRDRRARPDRPALDSYCRPSARPRSGPDPRPRGAYYLRFGDGRFTENASAEAAARRQPDVVCWPSRRALSSDRGLGPSFL